MAHNKSVLCKKEYYPLWAIINSPGVWYYYPPWDRVPNWETLAPFPSLPLPWELILWGNCRSCQARDWIPHWSGLQRSENCPNLFKYKLMWASWFPPASRISESVHSHAGTWIHLGSDSSPKLNNNFHHHQSHTHWPSSLHQLMHFLLLSLQLFLFI